MLLARNYRWNEETNIYQYSFLCHTDLIISFMDKNNASNDINMKILLAILLFISILTANAHNCCINNGDSLSFEKDTKYAVDWTLSLISVAQLGNAGTDLLIPFMGTDLIHEGESFPQSLIIECAKPTQELVERLKDYCVATSLPANYEWFYGFVTDEKFVIGIKDMNDIFTAPVTEVSVYSNAYNEFKPTLSCLVDRGEKNVNIENLEQFTTKHIMRTAITEINGDFVGIFTIFSPIEDESFDINGLPTAKINYLFHNTPIIPVNKIVTE